MEKLNRYITKFLHEYFNEIKRRKNSYLTITEQKLVCFLLKYFGFAPETVQESRFRQLFNNKYNATDHIMPLNIPGFFETNVKLYLEYIPYKVWSKGKINPLKEMDMHKEAFVNQFTMQMGDKPAENGGYPPTQNGDIRSLFMLFTLMAMQY